jgi:phytoene dehydrogenase-like protein
VIRWDAVVIGSGIGGLCCAGALAARGRKVLVLEQASAPGGYLTSFRRGEFVFDSTVDCFAGLDRNGLLTWVLQFLGVDVELPRVRIDPIRVSRFPGLTVRVDADLPAYVERLTALFPSEGKGIASFFRRCGEVYSDVEALMTEVRDERREAAAFPSALLRHRDATYGDLLREHLCDPRLMAVLSDRCPFLGLPPGRVSAVRMVSLIMSYFRSGAYRPVGGHQRLSNLLVEGIRRNGGKVLLNKGAKNIVVEGNRCTRVVAEDGEDFPIRHVVSNADFHETFSRLVGGEDGGRVADAAAVWNVSPSFFIVYAGVCGDLPIAEGAGSIGTFDGFDMDLLFRRHVPFKPGSAVGITVATIDDPNRAPPGHHSVLVYEPIPYGYSADWKSGKEELAERLLSKAERVIPGLTKQMVCRDAATPATLARYTRNRGGAAFGWEQTPRLEATRHGIENLYLAGHWTEFGGGVLAAAFSGVRAASRILRATA